MSKVKYTNLTPSTFVNKLSVTPSNYLLRAEKIVQVKSANKVFPGDPLLTNAGYRIMPKKWQDATNLVYNDQSIEPERKKIFHLQLLFCLLKGEWSAEDIENFCKQTPQLSLAGSSHEVEQLINDIKHLVVYSKKLSLEQQVGLIVTLGEAMQGNTLTQVVDFAGDTMPQCYDSTHHRTAITEIGMTGVDSQLIE